MKLSIILPCYNVAPYIDRAMESLFSQALMDYEIIIVDDGSTDDLLLKCEKWKSLDFVTIISTANQGVSEARNTGLRIAKGDYVFFMDPDDWLEKGTLADMLEKCVDANADAVRFNAPTTSVVEGNELLPRFIGFSLKDLKKFGREDFYSEKEQSFVWNYIIRRSVLTDNGVEFVKGLDFMEDKLFLCEFFCYAHKILQFNNICYHYEAREDGLTKTNFKTALHNAQLRLQAEKHREELCERVKKTKGIDLEPYYQGTLILASLELLANVRKGHIKEQIGYFKRYRSLPSVKRAYASYNPLRLLLCLPQILLRIVKMLSKRVR